MWIVCLDWSTNVKINCFTAWKHLENITFEMPSIWLYHPYSFQYYHILWNIAKPNCLLKSYFFGFHAKKKTSSLTLIALCVENFWVSECDLSLVQLQCDHCSKVFRDSWFLKQHQSVHQAERRVFKCPREGCQRTYTTPFNLQNHIISFHEEQRSFSCPHANCGKTFAMKVSTPSHCTTSLGWKATEPTVVHFLSCSQLGLIW